jgi:hypothetical protein
MQAHQNSPTTGHFSSSIRLEHLSATGFHTGLVRQRTDSKTSVKSDPLLCYGGFIEAIKIFDRRPGLKSSNQKTTDFFQRVVSVGQSLDLSDSISKDASHVNMAVIASQILEMEERASLPVQLLEPTTHWLIPNHSENSDRTPDVNGSTDLVIYLLTIPRERGLRRTRRRRAGYHLHRGGSFRPAGA